MNLTEIKKVLDDVDLATVLITSSEDSKSSDGNTIYKIYRNVKRFRATIDYLSPLDFLHNIIDKIKNTEVFKREEDIVASQSEDVTTYSAQLYFNLLGVKNLLDEVIQEDPPNSLRIKLPPVQDFEDISRVMNDLKRAISIPINDESVDGHVSIKSAESGSIWFLVALGSIEALRLVAELCWAAKVIEKKKIENQFVAKQIEEYALNNEQKKIMLDAQKQLIEKLLAGEANHIQQQFYSSEQPEQSARLVLAITTFSELYHKGADFRPALSAPENVANLFPSNKNQTLIESRIKQLEKGKDADSRPAEG